MAKDGWLKLHRKMFENEVVSKDADHIAIWVYILCEATRQPIPKLFGKSEIMLQPGQLVTGVRKISNRLGVSVGKVQRVLKRYKDNTVIDTVSNSKGVLISVLNWSKYQGSDTQSDTETIQERYTSDTEVIPNKNKEIKNKEDNNTLDEFFDKLWSIYPRKVGKGKVSVSKKKKLYSIGYDELERCVERYTRRIEMERIDNQFVMHGSTFFNSGYVDYLDKNYKLEQQPLPFTETEEEEEPAINLWD